MKNIIIIPARGNSKGIKKKNLISFCSKPLLTWTILQAKRSKYADDIFVSTESKEISNLCKKLRVKVINRPSELCRDTSSSESAIKHAIKKIDFKIDNIIFLQATSPLRKKNDIDNAVQSLNVITNSEDSGEFIRERAKTIAEMIKKKNK